MGPLGQKVLREIRAAGRRKVVDLGAVRRAREAVREVQEELALEPELVAELPANHREWMTLYARLAQLGEMLLGTRALRKLSERIEAAHEEYMPGGPPMSPVLDSVLMTFAYADLGAGPRGESLFRVIADIGPALRLADELTRAARIFAESRFGLYRASEAAGNRYGLFDLATEETVDVELPKGLESRKGLWLTRLLPPVLPGSEDWTIWTTPYHLTGREPKRSGPPTSTASRARWRRIAGTASSATSRSHRRRASGWTTSWTPTRASTRPAASC